MEHSVRTIRVYKHGVTMGTAPVNNSHQRALRGEVCGWTPAATRRNVAFLRSVVDKNLPKTDEGQPLKAFAVTLTVKNCPETPDLWHATRRAFMMRMERLGLYRSHWVVEWQRRGVPHLHCALWFEGDITQREIISAWIGVSAKYGAKPVSQYVLPIFDAVGWFKYMAKHAARGVKHYQRSNENKPEQWGSKTGRVWGHTGDWPRIEGQSIKCNDKSFFMARRMAKNWRIAEARAELHQKREKVPTGFQGAFLGEITWADGKSRPNGLSDRERGRLAGTWRLRAARGLLKCNERVRSELRGVSEWIGARLMLTMIECTLANGGELILAEMDDCD